jgi:cephalosporin hydroxylase
MDDRKHFIEEANRSALELGGDKELQALARDLVVRSDRHHWSYQWTWLGVPIIQMPPDIVAIQEIIWRTKPQLIIETGVARGGSLILYASILELLGEGAVIGVDVEIRDHNRDTIETHPLSRRIELIESDSLCLELHAHLKARSGGVERVMIILDSNHTHEHVKRELELFSGFVTSGQYLIVADTVVEYIPEQEHRPRPWGVGNNPATALKEFMSADNRFEPDLVINSKLLLTSSPGGYLVRK